MDKRNLMPTAAQPVNRITTGQLPTELAELQEEALSQLGGLAQDSASVLASNLDKYNMWCSYDGDDAE